MNVIEVNEGAKIPYSVSKTKIYLLIFYFSFHNPGDRCTAISCCHI